MCGIGCVLVDSSIPASDSSIRSDVVACLDISDIIKSRGPNSSSSITSADKSLWFTASVLHIQGCTPTDQPYTDDNGNVLLWNGEVFSGLPGFTAGQSDTAQISTTIAKAITDAMFERGAAREDKYMMADAALRAVSSCICCVNGPYAFLYYCYSLQLLIYGRDPLGRRSLLKLRGKDWPFALSSVWPVGDLSNDQDLNGETLSGEARVSTSDSIGHDTIVFADSTRTRLGDETSWEEVPVAGLYGVSIPEVVVGRNEKSLQPTGVIGATSAVAFREYFAPWPVSRIKLSRIVRNAPRDRESKGQPSGCFLASSELLLEALLKAVRCRVASIGFKATVSDGVTLSGCRVGVLFSGGIDSVVLAALLHLCSDPDEPIDLLNVAFTGADDGPSNKLQSTFSKDSSSNGAQHRVSKSEPPAPDRLAAISALFELKTLYPSREWRLVHVDVSAAERKLHEGRVKTLIRPRNTHMDLNIGTALWFASRGQGYLREYSELDMADAKNTKDNAGRPLVRTGGDGAAQSVGIPLWNQKVLVPNVDTSEESTSCTAPNTGLNCGNIECRRVGKKGCPRGLCKRCCNKQESSDVTLKNDIGSNTSNGNNSEIIPRCSVHKSSAKELEKMGKKLKEKLRFQGKELETVSDKFEISPEDFIDLQNNPIISENSKECSAAITDVAYATSCRALLIGIGADEQMVRYTQHFFL